jgi:hypothetical protein
MNQYILLTILIVVVLVMNASYKDLESMLKVNPGVC